MWESRIQQFQITLFSSPSLSLFSTKVKNTWGSIALFLWCGSWAQRQLYLYFKPIFSLRTKAFSSIISGPFALSAALLGFQHYRPDKVQLSSFIELYRQVKHCLCLQKEQAYWPEIRDHISISVWFKIELNYRVERSLFAVYKEHSNSHYGRAPTFWRKNGTGA
jgi:hypothetical protein